MEQYRITAEHTNGKSIAHCCTTGTISDPSELLDLWFEGEEEDAYAAGVDELEKLVHTHQNTMCACNKNHYWPGSDAWWDSVVFNVEAV
jgi:hypothetical protein